MTLIRATARAIGVAAFVLAAAAVRAQPAPVDAATDMVIGNADAPITIIEFASMTCSHCARFHAETLPGLTRDYLDTGKARLVFRDFPLDGLALVAAKLARCAGEERYFAFIGVLFQQQSAWAGASDPIAALGRIARLGGLGAERFTACLDDEDLSRGILEQRASAQSQYEIRATPTFVVNGEVHSGALTAEQFDDILQPLLP